jgi:hypothetical protein
MIKKIRSSFLHTFSLFILITSIALLFRITALQTIEFKGDEAINLFLAAKPVFGYGFANGATGSSLGILNPPLINYLLFPFVSISQNPQVISFFIGVINAIAIGIFFILVKKYYNLICAFISSLLFAISPWSILYSRKIWAQDFIIPLFIPFFFSLHKIMIDKKKQFWFLYAFSSLLLIQIHQVNIIFIFFCTLFLLLQHPVFSLKYFSLGILLGIIPLIPYIQHEAINHCPDCIIILQLHKKLSTRSLLVFSRPLQIIGQGDFQFELGNDMETFSKLFPFAFQLRKLFYFEYLFLPFSLFVFWKQYPLLRFLVYTLVILPFIYYALRIEPFMHYFIIIIPLLFLFLGEGFSTIIAYRNIYISYSAIAIFLLLLLSSFFFNVSFMKLLLQKQVIAGDYGTIFEKSEKIAIETYKPYANDTYYKEMILASYIPQSLIHGNQTTAQLIYDFNKTEKNLPFLEKRLAQVPIDRRVQNELIAYYTRTIISKNLLSDLKKKTQLYEGYNLIFQEVFQLYLSQNKKGFFDNGIFSFEYPNQWKVMQLTNDTVTVNDTITSILFSLGNVTTDANVSSYIITHESIAGQQTAKITCEDNSCKTIYGPLITKNGDLYIIYSNKKSDIVVHNILASLTIH